MRILVNCLTYGNRPLYIIYQNLANAGHSYIVNFINQEGIVYALNKGLENYDMYDAVAYLSNDIIEPKDWLHKKALALLQYPNAGIVASHLSEDNPPLMNDFIISNWLIKKTTIDKIGRFNEQYYPYGQIDLEYCQRTWLAGLCTYYVRNCKAEHIGSHAEGNEYGFDKKEIVNQMESIYNENIKAYKSGTKSIYL